MISFYARPQTIEEAVSLKAAHPQADFLAGGTDIVVNLYHDPGRERQLIDLSGLKELRGIDPRERVIGALTTFSQLLSCSNDSPETKLLGQMASQVAATQIRNRATVGGNICNANPSADSVPVLLVLDSQVEVADQTGTHVLPLHDFLAQRRQGSSTGLLLGVRYQPLPQGARWAFSKIGRRSAMAIARINGCGMLCVEDGVITQARLSLGAVAPVTGRLSRTEALLTGKNVTAQLLRQAGEMATEELRPFLEGRASASYKLPVLVDDVERLLLSCVQGQGEKEEIL